MKLTDDQFNIWLYITFIMTKADPVPFDVNDWRKKRDDVLRDNMEYLLAITLNRTVSKARILLMSKCGWLIKGNLLAETETRVGERTFITEHQEPPCLGTLAGY